MASSLRIGIIGFDTSHVPAFTRLLNDSTDPHHVGGATVVAGVPTFSADLQPSYSRVEAYTEELRDKFGVKIVDSIGELLPQVDAVLIESVDGRRHLAEAKPVIAAGKPLFIDKPFAANYADSAEIAKLARAANCPVFSSSSLRFDLNIKTLKNEGGLGDVLGCDVYAPAHLDPSNPGLFWYGVHGVEMIYTFMGQGCASVRCHHQADTDLVVGTWGDGRIATLRGLRKGAQDYGITVFGSDKIGESAYSKEFPLYAGLMNEVVPFLQGGPSPVPLDETLEMMAFMQAAFISQTENRDVALSELL